MYIANARIYTSDAAFTGTICIRQGLIECIDRHPPLSPSEIHERYGRHDEVTDATGLWLLPGVIDEHVHFREPGTNGVADIASESRAAAAGGVTSFMDMPNTTPPTTTTDAWEDKMQRAASRSVVNYAFYFGATNDNHTDFDRLDRSRVPALKVFMGSSTGGLLVDDTALDHIFDRTPLMIAVHAEDNAIIARNLAHYSATGQDLIPLHHLIRSREACLAATRRAIDLALKHQRRLHLLHITTAEELALIRSVKSTGLITAETCPHYLCFTNEDYAARRGRIKCNPSIKTEADRQALLEALADGTIDTIATDHAPHPLEAKTLDYSHCPSGMPSVQFSLPLMLHLAGKGLLSVNQVVRLMAENPARLYHIDRRGAVCIGNHADLVLIDPNADYTVSDSAVLSPCGWTPYDGFTLHHRVVATWVNGQCVYHNNTFPTAHAAQALRFN